MSLFKRLFGGSTQPTPTPRMRFNYDKRLPGLLAEIEEALVAQTPAAVAQLKVSEPAYAVFLWYDDSTAFDGEHPLAPDFGVGLEAVRSTWAKRQAEPGLLTNELWEYVWRPQQVIDELPPNGQFRDPALIAKCTEACELAFAANESGSPLADERELMRPFRSMMHRVASRLNQHAWNGVLKTTADFVVVSSDRLGYWLDEDLKQSISPAKFEILRQRGLLPGTK